MNNSITKETFEQEVINNISLSLVQFKTDWNGACQIVSAMYDVLAASYKGMVNFYTIDMEKENDLANKYGIIEIPIILFFKSRKVIDHVVGLIPKNTLIFKIENAILSADK